MTGDGINDAAALKKCDVGFAMALNSTQLTQTNSVMGSVHYLPPEQASGKGSTIQSDIYSMGILMYELLSGTLPYKGDNAVEIALKHLKEPLPSIRKEVPDIPQAVENVILKATAKNPKNRYSDARAMYDDLKTCTSESRADEKPYVYKYPEFDDVTVKKEKAIEKTMEFAKVSGDTDVDKESKVEVKKITDKDLKKSENKTLKILSIILASLAVFTDNVIYQMKAAEYLQGFSLEAIVTSILFSFIGYYNGHNQTLFVLFQGIAQSFLVRLPMAYVMSRMMPDSLVYVGAAAPMATVFGIAINLVYFLIFSRRELSRT